MEQHKTQEGELYIVFDFGGVLIDWSLYYLYRPFFNQDDEAIERFLKEVNFRHFNDQKDRGRPYTEILEELRHEFPQYETLLSIFETQWLDTVKGPIEPVVTILRKLKDSGKTLYALSNWSADKFQLVRRQYDFFNCFDVIIISGEEKVAKPDDRIYEILLERTGRKADECLFIDDSHKNIEAARRLGFHTIWYKSPEQLESELKARGIL